LKRRFLFCIAALLTLSQFGLTASAEEQWCASDPVFTIAKQPLRASVRFSADASTILYVSYELHVPQDVSAAMLAPADTTLPAVVPVDVPRVAERTLVVADAPPANGGAFTATLNVRVTTADVTATFLVTATLTGPYVQSPASYDGIANIPITIAIPISGA
jgi:hypothetical protein